MKTLRRFLFRCCCVAGLVCTPLTGWGVELVLNTNHTAAITSIFYQETAEVYVSTSRDGTVRTWVPGKLKTQRVFQVTNGSVEQAIPHPTDPVVAILVRQPNGDYEISSLNLNTGRHGYRIQIDDNPIHMDFSPQGSYLAYSLPRWDSISIHNARTGRRLNYLRSVGGIKTFFTFSRTEANIMTYQATTGELSYYSVTQGRELSRASTVSNLSNLKMLGTRFVVGTRPGQILVIDVVNGDVAARAETPDIKSIIVDSESSTIGLIKQQNADNPYAEYSFEGTRLIAAETRPPDLPSTIQRAAYHNRAVLTAGRDHKLRWHHRDSDLHFLFQAADLQPVRSLTLTGQQLHFSTEQGTVSIISDIFSRSLSRGIHVNEVTERISNPPNSTEFGITSIDNERAILYPTDHSRDMTVYEWHPLTDTYLSTPIEIDNPVADAHLNQDVLTLLTLQGNIHQVSIEDFANTFSFRNVDIQTVQQVGEHVIAGKSRTSGFQSPLLRIDPDTMETVPIDDDAILIFAMEYDPNRNLLYTLSLVEGRQADTTETVLRVHPGNSLERSRIIDRFEGEDLSAEIFFDSQRNRLYSSLGRSRLSYWNGSRMIQMQATAYIPRTVSGTGDLVWAANNNGTVSFWQAGNGVYIGTLAVLENGNWVFISPLGGFLSSDDFDPGVGLSLPLSPRAPKELIEMYRVRVPF